MNDDEQKNQEGLKEFLETIFPDKNTHADPKDLEISKFISYLIFNPQNIGSTTNLTVEQVEDIAEAEALNLVYKSPMISEYIDSFRVHRRSLATDPQNILQILTNIVSKDYIDNKNAQMLEALGKRFK